MLESALLIRWSISIVIIILLIIAFAVVLRILKQQGYGVQQKVNKDKMHLLDQFYIDSKNKIVKVKDGNSVLTILVGSSASVVKQEELKEEIDKKDV